MGRQAMRMMLRERRPTKRLRNQQRRMNFSSTENKLIFAHICFFKMFYINIMTKYVNKISSYNIFKWGFSANNWSYLRPGLFLSSTWRWRWWRRWCHRHWRWRPGRRWRRWWRWSRVAAKFKEWDCFYTRHSKVS